MINMDNRQKVNNPPNINKTRNIGHYEKNQVKDKTAATDKPRREAAIKVELKRKFGSRCVEN